MSCKDNVIERRGSLSHPFLLSLVLIVKTDRFQFQNIRLMWHANRNLLQSSSDYPAPNTPAIPIQRHFFEMIRSEKKKRKKKVQVPSVQ